MFYLSRVFQAIFRPRTLCSKIECTHEGTLHSELIDLGRSKRWWCTACDAMWFMGGWSAS